MSNSKQVLERLAQSGLRLKHNKFHFLQPNFDDLGYCIEQDGVHAMLTKRRLQWKLKHTKVCTK